MTSADLIETLSRAKAIGGARFTNIGDISCDPGVSHTLVTGCID
jgi:hypothetical protein